jgi:hypothetical protein
MGTAAPRPPPPLPADRSTPRWTRRGAAPCEWQLTACGAACTNPAWRRGPAGWRAPPPGSAASPHGGTATSKTRTCPRRRGTCGGRVQRGRQVRHAGTMTRAAREAPACAARGLGGAVLCGARRPPAGAPAGGPQPLDQQHQQNRHANHSPEQSAPAQQPLLPALTGAPPAPRSR